MLLGCEELSGKIGPVRKEYACINAFDRFPCLLSEIHQLSKCLRIAIKAVEVVCKKQK